MTDAVPCSIQPLNVPASNPPFVNTLRNWGGNTVGVGTGTCVGACVLVATGKGNGVASGVFVAVDVDKASGVDVGACVAVDTGAWVMVGVAVGVAVGFGLERPGEDRII